MLELTALLVALAVVVLLALAGMAFGADSRDGVDGAAVTGRRTPRGSSWW